MNRVAGLWSEYIVKCDWEEVQIRYLDTYNHDDLTAICISQLEGHNKTISTYQSTLQLNAYNYPNGTQKPGENLIEFHVALTSIVVD